MQKGGIVNKLFDINFFHLLLKKNCLICGFTCISEVLWFLQQDMLKLFSKLVTLCIFKKMQQSHTRSYTESIRCTLIYYIFEKNIKKWHATNYQNCHKKLAKLPNFTTWVHQFLLELAIPLIFKVHVKGLKKRSNLKKFNIFAVRKNKNAQKFIKLRKYK